MVPRRGSWLSGSGVTKGPWVWGGAHPVTFTGAHWEVLKLVTRFPPDAGWHTLIDRDIVVVARDEPGW